MKIHNVCNELYAIHFLFILREPPLPFPLDSDNSITFH